MPYQVLVCQSNACRKAKAQQVLAAFRAASLEGIEGVEVVASGCLGQCGNGPMVLVLPDEVWYWRVLPEEVGAIAHQHLQLGQPVEAMRLRGV
ncbi:MULTISPECIES: (2Fe-2S) ferredoxin domain-containing protein [Cyanophyceae]|uniref:(2Fe-2S) ferredoxin domain-containing protein n=1 Tax=Cyanophyceae TaxID=3028117 RepID=UPI00074D334A|nr:MULTISPECIES: (2Fe-2S) ferredoxin domain-containing protein [Cyanophyceae]MBF2083137.1 (2Fe-2S) ferredoxin domain-containing protein [Thermoleptolyngbya sp. C42_A2020_037]BAU42022.1 Ferredoxin, 2Fe-2S [Leptolyngbya sp. O-77]